MKSYINEIVNEIELQSQKNDICIIRLEGINTPVIYKEICSFIKNRLYNIEFNAKLSYEQYNEFKNYNKEEWHNSLNFLEINNYIDVDGSMTRWRNNSTELLDEFKNKKIIMLLMGTESVDDRGGLADFYCISPATIISKLSKDYSIWFKEIFRENGLDEQYLPSIDTLFKTLFKNLNIDLMKLSAIIDELSKGEYITVNEIIEAICLRLNDDWGIPSIISVKSIPEVKKTAKGKLIRGEIVTKSYKFINRLDYLSGISKSKLSKIKDKIEKYKNDNEIIDSEPFPDDNPQFNDFNEFSSALLDFISGKEVGKLRKSFLKIDFSIINSILDIKVETEKPIKESTTKLIGEPIEAYVRMVTYSIFEYHKKYKDNPNEIVLKVEEVKVANCATEEEKENSFNSICSFLGGILAYLQSALDTDEDNKLSICYENNIDPFSINQNSTFDNINKTANMNDLSKITFKVMVKDNEDVTRKIKEKFIYCFEPNSPWTQVFSIVNKYSLQSGISGKTELPLYGYCDSISDYICCESEEEFFLKLEKMKVDFTYNEYLSNIQSCFSNHQIISDLTVLCDNYEKFLETIKEKGFFNTFSNNLILTKMVAAYTKLLDNANDNFMSFTSNQKSKLFLLLNLFTIGGVKYRDFCNGSNRSLLIPGFHPIMVEKVFYSISFVKNGFLELIRMLNSGEIRSVTNIKNRIDNYIKMSAITSGFDAVALKSGDLLTSNRVFKFYAVYSEDSCDYSLISEKVFDNMVFSEDEVDQQDLLKKTRKSFIISDTIKSYITTFPAKIDGIDVLFINPDDIQHVVAGIHEVIRYYEEKELKGYINIKILTTDKRKNGSDYLKYWLNTYFESETDVKIRSYIKYYDIENSRNQGNIRNFIESQDVAFIYDILSDGASKFIKTSFGTYKEEVKFPMTFTPEPISKTQDNRFINTTQPQFSSSKAHLSLLHRWTNPDAQLGDYKVVNRLAVNERMKELVDIIHNSAKWVVCIDKAIDKNTLQTRDRKIIGFSTGEGVFGELNLTISAHEKVLSDLEVKLRKRLIRKFPSWDEERVINASKFCIDITKELDGSKLLKALNPYDFEIHNFLAYVLTLQVLNLMVNDDKYLIRNLINLDSHRHWFDNDLRYENLDKENRPDFLLLEVENTPENIDATSKLKIKATIIECKMGINNQNKIQGAEKQLEHGTKVLAKNWSTNYNTNLKRYWQNQLYRALIFSQINLADNSLGYENFVDKIYSIFNGNYTIEWNGAIYSYCLDYNMDKIAERNLDFDFSEYELDINEFKVVEYGQLFIQKMLVPIEERTDRFVFDEIKAEKEPDELINTIINADLIKEDNDITSFSEEKKYKPEEDDRDKRNDSFDSIDFAKGVDDSNSNSNDLITNDNGNIGQVGDGNSGQVSNEEKNIDDKSSSDIPLSDVRFLLGEDIRTGEKIYWEYGHPKLTNRHLLINGNSGSGKTYCIQTLLLEAAKKHISVVIFDYTDGFTKSKLSPILVDFLGDNLKELYVKYDRFPINPFRRNKERHGDREFDEKNNDIANRIASSFMAVYSFGPQQRNVIYESVMDGLDKYNEKMSFKIMGDLINEKNNGTASSVFSKIRPFLDYDAFDTTSNFTWKDIIDSKGEVFIIQLSGFERDIQLMLTELILWDIWSYSVRYGDEAHPLPIVLDEAQNLKHKNHNPSGKILAEGRKFGLSGWYATQFMKGRLDNDEIQNLQQAAQKLNFSPPDESVMEVAKSIDINTNAARDWAEKLKKLNKGQTITSGYGVKGDKFIKYEPKIIKVTSLEERTSEQQNKL